MRETTTAGCSLRPCAPECADAAAASAGYQVGPVPRSGGPTTRVAPRGVISHPQLSRPLAPAGRVIGSSPILGFPRNPPPPGATLPPRARHLRRLPIRPRTLSALAAVGLAVAAPGALAGEQSAIIGTGAKTCVLGPGADCRGVVQRWGVEHHGNLRRAKFTRTDLRGADFRGADLRGADFRGAKLRHADLRGANLKGARFGVVKRVGKRANQFCAACDSGRFALRSGDLTGANLANANLQGATFFYSTFTNVSLQGANLGRAWLQGATFKGSNLAGASLSKAVLNCSGPNGCESYFAIAGPNVVTFNDSDMSGTDFTGANFTGPVAGTVVFSDTNLTAARFNGAQLALATFFRANLTGASLTGANLLGASMLGANLSGAIVAGAQLGDVIWERSTCPNGTLTTTRC
jgi:uncharacterized protein YjbI with pentapeptide repeats